MRRLELFLPRNSAHLRHTGDPGGSSRAPCSVSQSQECLSSTGPLRATSLWVWRPLGAASQWGITFSSPRVLHIKPLAHGHVDTEDAPASPHGKRTGRGGEVTERSPTPPERSLSPSWGLICFPLPFCPLSPPSSPPTPSISHCDLRPSPCPLPLAGALGPALSGGLWPQLTEEQEMESPPGKARAGPGGRGAWPAPRGQLSPPAVWTDCSLCPPSRLRLRFCPSAQVCRVRVGRRLCGLLGPHSPCRHSGWLPRSSGRRP